jgi:hypothetical protein
MRQSVKAGRGYTAKRTGRISFACLIWLGTGALTHGDTLDSEGDNKTRSHVCQCAELAKYPQSGARNQRDLKDLISDYANSVFRVEAGGENASD